MRIVILFLFDLFVVNILFIQPPQKDSLFEIKRQADYGEVIDFIGYGDGLFLDIYNPSW